MNRTPIRVFAQFKGLSEQGARELSDHYEHDLCDFSQGELEFEYEGPYFMAEDFVELARNHLLEQGQGWVDVIDNLDWTVTRYHVLPGGATHKTLPIDSVLEQYHQE